MDVKKTGCTSALKYLTRKNKADMILGFSSVRAQANLMRSPPMKLEHAESGHIAGRESG
ncbi:hypothetical protein [Caballeronia sp. J97]|uniref:hypothetical protein n=1 Tax=Caballeronia sp. J97 TaxID=2805429 RepID=UPI002AB05B9C|nr:hypothetical protein [Caballeronia sp. J97]